MDVSFSVKVTMPKGWSDLTQEQLNYVFTMLSSGFSKDMAKAYVLFRIGTWIRCEDNAPVSLAYLVRLGIPSLQEAFSLVGWMDDMPDIPVRLEELDGVKVQVSPLMHELSFEQYLMLENRYQSHLASGNFIPIDAMTAMLYGKEVSTPVARYNTIFWFCTLKQIFAAQWPDLFPPPSENGQGDFNPAEAMNAQLRALTGGDITKEAAVRQVGCWRALEELNAKAKDLKRIKKS